MAEPILMPRLTIDMEKGTVLEWHKEPGDEVRKGDVVAVVFGDKVEWEVEAPADGVLLKTLVPPDGEAPVGHPIGFVGEAGEVLPEDLEAFAEALAPAGDDEKEDLQETKVLTPIRPPAQDEKPAQTAKRPPGKPKASPAARRLAREMGVDLADVKGSGPGGRIVESDVQAAAETPASPTPVRLAPLRKTIAERMARSWREVPHFTVETTVDMTRAQAFRQEAKARGDAVTLNDLVVASVAKALASHEAMRRRWEGETLTALPGSSLGVAVHTEEGLMVPVVENVATKSPDGLSAEIRTKADRARNRRLLPEDLKPACMTVTNLGMFGITRFTPVINHPECAILAVGKVEERPVARDGWIGVQPRMALDLAVDHRAIDGGTASQFLAAIKEILETGAWAFTK